MRLSKQGSRESFDDYVRGRSVALVRIAYLLTGDAHLAEDLVQQTLINVAGRWGKLRSDDDPDAYVRKVLYHQHVSWWRRHRRDPLPTAVIPERSTPARDVSVAVTVMGALRRLAPRQRAVIVLRYFEDMTETQTAEMLGIAVGTVKSTTRDALAKLRKDAPELAELVEVNQ
ncbi:SigE family RNA polymerase sigma factor [Catellatospora tritici]|uniref:SigE family RNA polymerase sigma factor n=1 Tax=Catellatospora tritici TaxID=2851566 RepID=UPI0027E13692|nr:SigE family RNA polymerase sigma factor [Catellatospora tritici]